MMLARWDFLELPVTSMARLPRVVLLKTEGDNWHWINRPLNIDQIFGDPSTLPYEPMEYIGRQCQGDFSIRTSATDVWMDAGIITTQADWSLDFDVGMNFME